MHKRRVGGPGMMPDMGHHSLFDSFPPMNMGFSNPHQQHHHHLPQPNLAQIAAQTMHAEMDAERMHLEAERVRAEALINEERCRLENELHREEHARLEAAEQERRLQWAKDEAVRAERRREEESVRLEREARQREIDDALAQQRCIQAREAAERARIQEEQNLAAIKINEERTETQRVSVYEAHRSLITKASEMELLELRQQIEALAPLTNPIPRFQQTTKKGMPLAADGKTSLFLSILNNKKLGNEEQFKLLELLMTTKGYGDYLNLLLSSPILEQLVAEAQPKPLPAPNAQGVVILPDPFIILRAVFQYAVSCRIHIDQAVAQKIYPVLIMAGCGIDVFHYHYEQKTAAETMQFLLYWRTAVVEPRHEHQYLLATYKEMKEDFFQLLKADYLNLQFNPPLPDSHYGVFTRMVLAAGTNKERVCALLDEWCPLVQVNDVVSFMEVYARLLTLPKKEECLGLKDNYITKIIQIHEGVGKQFYEHLKANNVSTPALMWILKCWLAAFKAPHNFSMIKEFYFELIKDKPATIAQEDKVWEGLIKTDEAYGLEIFKYLVDNNASKTKLMSYMDVWMDALPNDAAIRAAYYKVKPLIQNSSLSDFRFPLRAIAEMNTVKLVPEKRTIADEQATKKFLRVTRPGFFGMSCSNAHSSFRAYEAVRDNVRVGKSVFEQEREQAELEINQKLRAAGEEGHFKFRVTPNSP